MRGRKRKVSGRVGVRTKEKLQDNGGSDSESSSAFCEEDNDTEDDEDEDEMDTEDEEAEGFSDGEEKRKRMVKRGVSVTNAFSGMDAEEKEKMEKELLQANGEDGEEDDPLPDERREGVVGQVDGK